MTSGGLTVYAKSYDLIGVMAATVVAALASLFVPPLAGLGVLLVLVLPGYALMALLFARRMPGIPEQVMLVLGISLAIAAVGGVTMNLLGVSLQRIPWVALLSTITVLASEAALLRRHGRPVSHPRVGDARLSTTEVLLFGLAGLVAVVGLAVSRRNAVEVYASGSTQFWMLPAGGTQPNAVQIGIASAEPAATTFAVQIQDGSYQIQSPPIKLAPGKKWETTIEIPHSQSGPDTVEARLYLADRPGKVYRIVRLSRPAPGS